MRKKILIIPCLLIGGLAAQPRDTLPPGTQIQVRTNESIDARRAGDGRIYSAVIDRDVRDPDGRVLISRGSNAELIIRDVNRGEMVLDMDSIMVNDRRYVVSTTDQQFEGDRKDGVGSNSRTGKYVGGGAVVGAIIGAIAGGGKGAAIGAAAGAGAGAGGQVLTRGREVRIPAESIITFQLDRPLRVSMDRDNGYDRDGHHYHRDRPYDRQ